MGLGQTPPHPPPPYLGQNTNFFLQKSTLKAPPTLLSRIQYFGCRDNKCGQFFKIALSDSRTGPGLHESDSQSLFQIVQKYFSSGNLHQSLASVHPLCTQICVAFFLFQRIDISTGHGQAGREGFHSTRLNFRMETGSSVPDAKFNIISLQHTMLC